MGGQESSIPVPAIVAGDKVIFHGNYLPFEVMAASERYLVCVRKLNRYADSKLLWFEVERGASRSFTDAWKENRDSPVYTIVDFKENIRGTNDFVFNIYNYWIWKDCARCITDLMSGKAKISYRTRIELNIEKIKRQ